MTQDVFRAEVRRPISTSTTYVATGRTQSSAERESNRLLSTAVTDGNLDVLRHLLVNTGLDANSRDDHGNTVGHQAAVDGCADELTMLLCHGLEIDAVNKDGDTALHLASRYGMAKAARALADAFPDENVKNNRGFTPFDEATAAGRTRCTKCIRDFKQRGKVEAIENHCRVERDRLEKQRRHKEILFGRDVDVLPREADFRSLRSFSLSGTDRARINASLQATTVTLRCVAAGLQAAVETLEIRQNTAGTQDSADGKAAMQ